MKVLYRSILLLLILLAYGCSKTDDDNSDSMQDNTMEFLTSGKWYFETRTPGMYSSCEKRGYIQFRNNGNLTLESFDDSSGTCQSDGVDTATYTLTNETNLTIEFGSESETAVIILISEEVLTLETDDETLGFDKNAG